MYLRLYLPLDCADIHATLDSEKVTAKMNNDTLVLTFDSGLQLELSKKLTELLKQALADSNIQGD
jgi:hypothetical protein